jgi:hypothetical protein
MNEADILDDVIDSGRGVLNPEAARFLLKLKFSRKASERIRRLLQKNNRGTLQAHESALLERYLRVGQLLDLLQAKAKLALNESAGKD